MRLYKFETESKILFFLLYIQKQIGGPFCEFIKMGMEHWIFSLYIYISKQIGKTLGEQLNLGLELLNFCFSLKVLT
jgi:hypothetical protein